MTVRSDGTVGMMVPLGRRADPKSRIYPFKLHRAKLPVMEGKRWIIPMVVEEFFGDGNIDRAVKNAAKEFYGVDDVRYGWTDTSRYMGIFHGVRPATQAVGCLECHGPNGRIEWQGLGYAADPLELRPEHLAPVAAAKPARSK